jgi:uncharacterized protein (DUF4415 family)
MSKTSKLPLQSKSAGPFDKAKILMPSLAQDRAIKAAAKSDPNAAELSTAQLKAMQPVAKLRGRPKAEQTKQLVSLRYSASVIDYFRATGQGWQARMDAVLAQYVTRQLKKST